MSLKFKQNVEYLASNAKKPLLPPGKYLTISGTSIYKFMCGIVKTVENACPDVTIKLLPIENDFFGHTVNCTGLLTGGDILRAVQKLDEKFDVLLIPDSCLMRGEDIFLDDVTLTDLSKKLGMKVVRAVIPDAEE